jgi:diketogulonate reductase-like aldo/keto reductase
MHRREFMASVAVTAGAAALPMRLAAAQSTPPGGASATIMKSAPRIREALPAVGLGTFLTFDLVPGERRDHLRQVMQTFWDAGGRVVDTSPLYGMAEVNVGDFAASMGVTDRMFIANKIWATGEYLGDASHARRSLDTSLQRLWRGSIDAMQCHSLVNASVVVPLLGAWKKEGRVRYTGVSHHEPGYFGELADWVEQGDLDVVQVHYSMHARMAEERILPAAAARGMAVFVNMPFEKARLLKVVEGHPLPGFAREIGIASWPQYFLKWVIAHPAVTCVLPATSNPVHAADNMQALQGPLPDRALRARMLRHMESIPGFDAISSAPMYPGRRYRGLTGDT